MREGWNDIETSLSMKLITIFQSDIKLVNLVSIIYNSLPTFIIYLNNHAGMKSLCDQLGIPPSEKYGKAAREEKKKKIFKQKPLTISRKHLRSFVLRCFQKKRIFSSGRKREMSPECIFMCLNEQQYSCMICMELMMHPVTLQCGHSFCLLCVESLNKTEFKFKCSLCRSDDHKQYYEIDKTVEKIVGIIYNSKLPENEKNEYQCRKKGMRKEFKERGARCQLRMHDEIKIRVKNIWERGRIVSIIKKNRNIYYEVHTLITEEKYCINHNSINLYATEEDRQMREKGFAFSQNIFLEEYNPLPSGNINNSTIDYEDLLLEVNYYQPNEDNGHNYDSQEEVSYQQLQDILRASHSDDSIQPDMVGIN